MFLNLISGCFKHNQILIRNYLVVSAKVINVKQIDTLLCRKINYDRDYTCTLYPSVKVNLR